MCEVQIRVGAGCSVWPFQICSKTHSDPQPVVDSPQTVGGVLYLVMFLRPVHTDAESFAETSQSSYF